MKKLVLNISLSTVPGVLLASELADDIIDRVEDLEDAINSQQENIFIHVQIKFLQMVYGILKKMRELGILRMIFT